MCFSADPNLGNTSNLVPKNILSNNIKTISRLSKKKLFLIEIDSDNINLIEI